MVERRAVAWFLALAFLLGWGLLLIPLAYGHPGSPGHMTAAVPCWVVAAWMPGIAAMCLVATGAATRPGGQFGLGTVGPRAPYLWAWLIPLITATITALATVKLGLGRPAEAPTGIADLNARLVVALGVAPAVNMALTLGEELGWRAFLLPRLLPLGAWRAIFISGLAWGLWYAPAVYQGYCYPGHPVLGILVMSLFCVLAGTIFSWLYLATGSVWAPTLAHGTMNASGALPALLVSSSDPLVAGSIASLTGCGVLALAVASLIAVGQLPPRATGRSSTGGSSPDASPGTGPGGVVR